MGGASGEVGCEKEVERPNEESDVLTSHEKRGEREREVQILHYYTY